MKSRVALGLIVLCLSFAGLRVYAINLVKGGAYEYNGVARCEIVGVGGAGVRIKFESGGYENLSLDQAQKALSFPGKCSASNVTETREQLAMIDKYKGEAWGDVDGLFPESSGSGSGRASSAIQ